jgi:hypothetical protein
MFIDADQVLFDISFEYERTSSIRPASSIRVA